MIGIGAGPRVHDNARLDPVTAMAAGGVRRNGLQRPWGLVPVGAWVGQIGAMATFLGLAVPVLGGLPEARVLYAYPFLAVPAIACWVFCQAADPGKPGGLGLPCMRETQSKGRYCAACKKVVPGLDHHCKWLNTCVGARTYAAFYALSLLGTLLSLYQLGVALWIAVDQRVRDAGEARLGAGLFALLGASLLSSLVLAGSYSTLWAFHTYLLYLGKGTYQYMVDARERSLAAGARHSPKTALATAGAAQQAA